MNIDDWKIIFISIFAFLIVIAFMPVVNSFILKRDEKYITLAMLGEDGYANDYYPYDDNFINTSAIMNWSIYLQNNMNEIKYISLKIKFLNYTTESPNSTLCVASLSPVVYEMQRILKNKEIYIFPLSWSIVNIQKDQINLNNYTYIKSMSINGHTIDTNVLAINGINYRIVVELWLYDDDLRNFRFRWNDGIEDNCVWNQIWFNVNEI